MENSTSRLLILWKEQGTDGQKKNVDQKTD